MSKQAECPGDSASFREAHPLPGFLWRRRCAGNSNRTPPLRHRRRIGSFSVSLRGGRGSRRVGVSGNGNGAGSGVGVGVNVRGNGDENG